MFAQFGFQRVAAVQPPLHLADPERNGETVLAWAKRADEQQAALTVFPELCLTGYTCEDLFHRQDLLERARRVLASVVRAAVDLDTVLVVGAPYQAIDGRAFNCAFVIHRGRLWGAIPKLHLPNYGEFYEKRWFTPGRGVDLRVNDPLLGSFRLSAEQVFCRGLLRFALEICEDLWAPIPPSCYHALAGANVIVNPSASNELVAKSEYRRELVKQQSARLLAGYVYAACGPGESTKDIVFGGDCLIAENGALLAASERFDFEGHLVISELDLQKLQHERVHNVTFANAERPSRAYEFIDLGEPRRLPKLERSYARTPFVPDEPQHLQARAREIVDIQATGLARRLVTSRSAVAVLGLSGGLDSTLALLVCMEAVTKLKRPASSIVTIGMPGFGTTDRTRSSAVALARSLGVEFREIPIRAAVLQHFADINHEPTQYDVVYENAQARERTQILFDLANQMQGLVVGTGDMSELALGFCTYNADHMAGYAVNVSVPKTLVRHLVRWYARTVAGDGTRRVLETILDTPVSPELLPPTPEGTIAQETEALIGPYVLHDFFLFHHVRNGFGPRKILALAEHAFAGEFPREELERWLRVFLQRFYAQQFKRTCLPPGPKVGSVSLSPRGDLRMPDEVDPRSILSELDRTDP